MQENTVEWLLLEKNEQGMDALLLHYGPLMRYIIAPILQNPQDREDCLSEVSMRVWEKIGQFDGEKGSFRAWLTAITRNTALNHARKASGSSTEELSESTPSPEPSPEEALLKKERQEALSAALNRLSYKDRLLFYRKYYYRQSTAQIAAELGMSLEIVANEWDSLIPAVQSGAVDGIIAGMSPTEERMQEVDFTHCYYRSNLVIIFNK